MTDLNSFKYPNKSFTIYFILIYLIKQENVFPKIFIHDDKPILQTNITQNRQLK